MNIPCIFKQFKSTTEGSSNALWYLFIPCFPAPPMGRAVYLSNIRMLVQLSPPPNRRHGLLTTSLSVYDTLKSPMAPITLLHIPAITSNVFPREAIFNLYKMELIPAHSQLCDKWEVVDAPLVPWTTAAKKQSESAALSAIFWKLKIY